MQHQATMKCAVCLDDVRIEDIKYHTPDGDKIFCGPSCSLKYHQGKDNEKTNNNIEDFNNTNSNSTDTTSG